MMIHTERLRFSSSYHINGSFVQCVWSRFDRHNCVQFVFRTLLISHFTTKLQSTRFWNKNWKNNAANIRFPNHKFWLSKKQFLGEHNHISEREKANKVDKLTLTFNQKQKGNIMFQILLTNFIHLWHWNILFPFCMKKKIYMEFDTIKLFTKDFFLHICICIRVYGMEWYFIRSIETVSLFA